jgi:DNA replication ATP-dependent helicase Dna2
VQNERARKGGYDISLFKLLSDRYPEAVVALRFQYRMNSDIMSLSNTLIYKSQLQCGTDSVAKKRLAIPNISGLDALHVAPDTVSWLRPLFDERYCVSISFFNGSRNVVFLDTYNVPARETRQGDIQQNNVEATLVQHCVEGLLACGITQDQIGVISPYRSQLKVLTHLLRHRRDIETHTVDKYQGRDKDIIIISFVRSNDAQHVRFILLLFEVDDRLAICLKIGDG